MHRLSTEVTWIFFYFVFPIVIVETFYVVITSDPFLPGLLAFPLLVLAFVFFYFRRVRVVSYDGESLYARRFLKTEKIPLADVASVNAPDSAGDIIFEIELKSGRLIDFIPTFQILFIWQKPEVPGNVRRFQTILANLELKQ